jgi:tetrahydromethanopterin S-methyltransferase subunit G
MSYKIDTVISQLDEIMMRLDRIEHKLNYFSTDMDDMPMEAIDEAFEKVFGKKVDKPQLHVVQSSEETNNIVEFKTDET